MDIDKKIADELRKSILEDAGQEYVPGEWEGFLAYREAVAKRRRSRVYAFVSVAAAAAILIGLLLPVGNHHIQQPVRFVGGLHSRLDIGGQLHSALLSKEVVPVDISYRGSSSLVAKGTMDSGFAVQEVAVEDLPVAKDVGVQVAEENPVAESNKTDVPERFKNPGESRESDRETEGQKDKVPYQTLGQLREKSRKGVRFGVNFSPGFNSSSVNSNGSFNYGGGVTMDIAIAGNISITTGLQVEHQNVDNQKKEGVGVAAMPSSHMEASLTSLDIPVNITWSFFNGKRGSYYVSGGFSTLAYLDEKYTRKSYSQEVRANVMSTSQDETLTTYRVENVETVRTTVHPALNTLDLAGRLNLIFGYRQRISPTLNLHVEPFVKIPLSGLASENIRFTTGGVTFKVSF